MSEDALAQAFPPADPGIRPLGSRILVQIRTPETKSAGGIILTEGDRDTTMWNTQVAKVISVGPLAFKNRNTMESWPEGSWCKEGEYVRVAKYGGDRWEVNLPNGESALFVIFNDLDIIGRVEVDPLSIRAFI